jgi:hypothetical protein
MDRFWVPVAQILPVFILGLVVEARFALRRPAKVSDGQARWEAVMDRVVSISYALVFALAMTLLVLAFIICLLVMVDGKPVDPIAVLTITLLGVAFTGLLPVLRLLGDQAMAHLVVPFVEWLRRDR